MKVLPLAVLAMVTIPVLGSLEAGGTSRWDEGSADFQRGTGQNTITGNEGVWLDRNLAHPASWVPLGHSSPEPAPRCGQVLACDDINDIVVLFGGHGASYLGDTWHYDPGAGDWTRMGHSGGPSALDGAAMAFDSRSGLFVLFGGESYSSQYGYRYFNETWVYDAGTDRWSQRSPSDAPSPRIGHSMSFDPSSGLVVLFGGEYYDPVREIYGSSDETWTYNATTDSWTNRSGPNGPSARLHHATALDGRSGEMILFGGWGGREWTGTGYSYLPRLADTWSYDVASGAWTNRTTPFSPGARSDHALTFDASAGCIVLFGGMHGVTRTILGDTWMFDSGMDNWIELDPPGSPFCQYGHAMAYVPALAASLLFSGYDESGNISETWSYAAGGNRWTKLQPSSAPSPRSGAAMAYDSAGGQTVLFGGQFIWGPSNDTWTYSSESNSWSPATPSTVSPPAREGHALVWDPRNNLMVLFGGVGRSGDLGDTWTYDPATNAWSEMRPSSAPCARRDHAMAYDSANGEVLLFGGMRIQYSPYIVEYFGDTWACNVTANRWLPKVVQPAPSARGQHSLAYDASRGTAVLFGGYGQAGKLGDTWTYNSSRGRWSDVTPPISPRPGFDYALAYGGPSADILLFGGWDGNVAGGGNARICNPYPNETWTYCAGNNTWTNRSCPAAPARRFSASMAYDTARNGIILFGGYSFQNALADTWLFGSRAYFASGLHTSSPFDTGGSAFFGSLRWEADVQKTASVRFQFRTAGTEQGLLSTAFTGPDGTAATYYTINGGRLSGVRNGDRWAQYRACLGTGDLSATPLLRSVAVSYNLLQEVAILSPAGGENWTGAQNITWTASDPDNDNLTFELRLLDAGREVLLASGLPSPAASWEWDTARVPNGTYKIRLTARDDSAEIPLAANTTSPEFSILHPAPPNHPPAVELLSPADGSTVNESTVRFRWRGEDQDENQLLYNLTYWIESPEERGRASVTTLGTFFNATILDDGVAFRWNVTAFDGRDRSAPAPPWRFVMNRTPPNRPPVITSTAPLNATAGIQFEYRLTASDPDGDPLAYALPSRPEGMVLGPVLPGNTGIRILWTPTKAQGGPRTATVAVTDGRGGRAEQSFTVQVALLRPGCAITRPAAGETVRGLLAVNGTATRGSAEVARVEVRIDGGPWMQADGTLRWGLDIDTAKLGNGNHTIEAVASDGELASEPASVRISVDNPVTGPKPSVVTLEGVPWLVLAVVLAAAGAATFLVLRRGRRP